MLSPEGLEGSSLSGYGSPEVPRAGGGALQFRIDRLAVGGGAGGTGHEAGRQRVAADDRLQPPARGLGQWHGRAVLSKAPTLLIWGCTHPFGGGFWAAAAGTAGTGSYHTRSGLGRGEAEPSSRCNPICGWCPPGQTTYFCGHGVCLLSCNPRPWAPKFLPSGITPSGSLALPCAPV